MVIPKYDPEFFYFFVTSNLTTTTGDKPFIFFDFPVGINADRVKVLLSVLRHCPLIDANHSSSFMHLGDTHYEKNQNFNKKKQVLVIYGEDDGNHTFVAIFFNYEQKN